MTDRDRLIELVCDKIQDGHCVGYCNHPPCSQCKDLADYILADGWIRPPCYIGQEIWYLCEHYDGSFEIKKGKISMLQQKADKSWKFRITINSSVWDFKVEDIGVWYFLTKEEAEEKLKELGK